jgi:hypothetical protein
VYCNFLLQPDSSAIICGTTAAATVQQYVRTFGVTSFPSLDNSGGNDFYPAITPVPLSMQQNIISVGLTMRLKVM